MYNYLLYIFKPLVREIIYLLSSFSSETVSLLRPLALLAANILRPFLDAILERNPCLLALFLLDG